MSLIAAAGVVCDGLTCASPCVKRGLRGTSGFVFHPTSCAEVTGASYLSCGAFCALSSLRGWARQGSVRLDGTILEAEAAVEAAVEARAEAMVEEARAEGTARTH